MAKNKGKMGEAKASETALAPPDEFVSLATRITNALKPYARYIAAGLVLVVVAAGAYATLNWWKQRKLTRATEAWFAAVRIADAPIIKADAKIENKPALSYLTAEERDTAFVAELEKLQKAHAGTAAARSSAILQAKALFDLGKFEESKTAFQAAAQSDVKEIRYAATLGMAAALEAKALAADDDAAKQAGLKEAIEAYRATAPADGAPGRAYALYHQARLTALLGDNKQAVALFEQALQQSPNGDVEASAKVQLAALKEGAGK